MAGAAAAAAADAPTRRLLPAVTLRNECGAEKVCSTTLRPTSLPHTELYDLEGVAQACQGWGRLESGLGLGLGVGVRLGNAWRRWPAGSN